MADSGSPFRQSVLLNVGGRDGIVDGWAAMDGLGLVGRISGVGDRTARVVLLTDTSSRIPVTVQPSGQQRPVDRRQQRLAALCRFHRNPRSRCAPATASSPRAMAGCSPPVCLVGQLAAGSRAAGCASRLAADYERLEFLRVLRNYGHERVLDPGSLIQPSVPVVQGADPDPEPQLPAEAQTSEATDG